MDLHADPLVNRDDPIPVVAISAPRDDPSPTASERRRSKRASIRQSLSTEKLKEKLDGFTGHGPRHQRSASTSATAESPTKIQDRLMNM
ncbi:Integral peroxisomal membrane peroxin [Neofusicoccum parvum]|nr:putative integral peroxisomal membrane peroxin protein [Neofusicoccum parvum UCRNP2]GME33850.1 Integral peroxisomal membrane peroxin [Neofusicoccum parvum]GME57829.1 Integral peroxisomal membrane peroxin [Neofusicoccum parvum]